ncbi:MAG TPA: Gfo/Idh/MocA family oxidoreductase [Casimicrobiaceae bacterium]|nr:Gfo/Idh/MocA family oxidoreductase [Casimicrobiaceae bacterium]
MIQDGGGPIRPVRWGVLSPARIGLERVLPGMRKSRWCDLRVMGSRSLHRARAAAASLDIPVCHGSYEEVLDDPAIEAIYNPLPNHLHVPWTLKAAAAGKHVLCEKPIAMTGAEAESLRAVTSGVLIAEAFMVRFHPQWLRARDLVRQGRIGDLTLVQMTFGYRNVDSSNIRNAAGIGGGALYDIGCYAVVAGRFFFESEPERAVSLIDRDPAFRTDRLTSALVDFGVGRHLDFTVATQIARSQRLTLCGTTGRIDLPIPVNAPQGAATTIAIDDCNSLDGSGIVTETLAESDQYMLQGEAFSKAVRGIAPFPYGVEDAIANMRVLDALFRSERSRAWEDIARSSTEKPT